MINKKVQIISVKTMADKTVRLTIDLLNGDAIDFASSYKLMSTDTTMILAKTEELIEALTTVSNQIILNNT